MVPAVDVVALICLETILSTGVVQKKLEFQEHPRHRNIMFLYITKSPLTVAGVLCVDIDS